MPYLVHQSGQKLCSTFVDKHAVVVELALALTDHDNLTAALVGDFDPAEARALAERYFGRLERGERPPARPRTREMPQLAEKRMVAYAETNPQVTIRYHSVPDGHVDEPPLVVLGQLLNGRTGRLYKALVEEQEVATGAGGGQNGLKFEGMFVLQGTAKEGRTPEEVEQALYAEIERLKTEPVEPPPETEVPIQPPPTLPTDNRTSEESVRPDSDTLFY